MLPFFPCVFDIKRLINDIISNMSSIDVTSDFKEFMSDVKSELRVHRIEFTFIIFVTSDIIWLKYPIKSNICPHRIELHFPEL